MEQLHFVVVCIKLYVLGDKLNVSMDVKAQNENIVSKDVFNLEDTINELKKYLPAQAPLKDFIFQNNLEAFLHLDFVEALHTASTIFGYKTYLSLQEFRTLYQCGEIRKDILEKVIIEKKGKALLEEWKDKLLYKVYEDTERPRVGSLRSEWITKYQFDIEALVNPVLFRVVCSYLDQGISIWNFPLWKNGFLMSIKEMEQNSFTSFFKTERPKRLLLEGNCEIEHLLSVLVGDCKLYKQYLFDQQFAHQGWSGMVSVIESRPETLMDVKEISLHDLITFELLLEIDFLDDQFGTQWQPLGVRMQYSMMPLFSKVVVNEYKELQSLWQESYEWSYFDQVLAALKLKATPRQEVIPKSFQALFCIDDRETSLRDYLEKYDASCETFGTPGFFNVEFYYKPEHGKALTKLCPAPLTPMYMVKEVGNKTKRKKDLNFEKRSFSLSTGWIVTQTVGFWDAIKLAKDIFSPSMGPTTASSFRHMDKDAKLTIVYDPSHPSEDGLQLGFTIDEMVQRVEGLLLSIGLIKDFAPLIYVIGHGASSVNNPFFATMDCGACSCRPGSVNARVFAYMANLAEVRVALKKRSIEIPDTTMFVGGLHDTTRDEVIFYDEDILSAPHHDMHKVHQDTFAKALRMNAKERSRRFASINTHLDASAIHKKIKTRSVSLFEPRPELDHATNALTVIGHRNLTRKLFLDRRCFLNSYDFRIDPKGNILKGIMKPIAPVCGGINLSYYFSKVDNQRLGAGTKLPHNVMGLFGVANGIDGDLRPGLPSQMVESHDPIRIIVVVEHYPEVVLEVLQSLSNYNWYLNTWMHVAAIHPETHDIYIFKAGAFYPYEPLMQNIKKVGDMLSIIEQSQSHKNIPVHIITD